MVRNNNNTTNKSKHHKGSSSRPGAKSSPYAEAATILSQILNDKKSFKNLVYSHKDGKLLCTKTTYAQVCQVLLYKTILDLIVQESSSEKLRDDIHNTGMLYVLLYELLLGPNKTIKGGGAVKRKIVQHEAALRRALEQPKILTLLQRVESHRKQPSFPRYARVNTLLTSIEEVCQTLLAQTADNEKDMSSLEFYVDPHIPNLLVFPHSIIPHIMSPDKANAKVNSKQTEPTNEMPAILTRQHEIIRDMVQWGKLILQDKSSCFSALCLVHGFGDKHNNSTSRDSSLRGNFIDACAAPGNKTQHLATLVAPSKMTAHPNSQASKAAEPTTTTTTTMIYAMDRSSDRLASMARRMKQLVPSSSSSDGDHPLGVQVITKAQDFLETQPSDYQDVQGILLDPSCSGSGIYTAPDRWVETTSSSTHNKLDAEETKRIESLANFQEKALCHAMSFPSVRRVVYSTCSLHDRENEIVVQKALSAVNDTAANQNNENEDKDKRDNNHPTTTTSWQVVAPTCLRHWKRRGNTIQGLDENDTNAMIRACSDDETNGFFVCCLQRKQLYHEKESTSKQGSQKESNLIIVPKGLSLYNGQFAKKSLEGEKEKLNNDTSVNNPPTRATSDNRKKVDKSTSSSKDSSCAQKEDDTNKHNELVAEKKLAKKAGKKLAWKKRQMEEKQERLKQKKLKTSN